MKKALICLAGLTLALVCQSRASTWSLDYSGSGVSADITLTTAGALTTFEGKSGYSITGISGERNGVAITGLVAATTNPISGFSTSPDGRWWFDNVLLSSGGFDLFGLLFTTANGGEFNLYKENGHYIDGTVNRDGCYDLTPVSVTVSRNVPDSGLTFVLLGGTFAGLVMLRRRFVR